MAIRINGLLTVVWLITFYPLYVYLNFKYRREFFWRLLASGYDIHLGKDFGWIAFCKYLLITKERRYWNDIFIEWQNNTL
jgi:hypothetical protein